MFIIDNVVSIIIEGDVDHQQSSQRPSRGTPTFKSPSVGIARDFGKGTPEFENEGIWEADIDLPCVALAIYTRLARCAYKTIEL